MNLNTPHLPRHAPAHEITDPLRKSQGGFTLIEALVAGTLGLIVAATIFFTANIAISGTQQLQAQQELQQESALITETFTRTVRNGNFICVGGSAGAPATDTDNVANITVRAKDSSVVATFAINADSLVMNGNRYLTCYLCRLRNPLSHFKVLQNGRAALCYLSLSQTLGNNTTQYTQTIGEVQCKN